MEALKQSLTAPIQEHVERAIEELMASLPSVVLLVHRPLSSATMFSLGTIDSTSSKKVSRRTCPSGL